MKKMNKKGFTLIELLAVIIILGVLMIIAIPAVTSYIQNSRKSAYVDTAGAYVSAVRTKVNEGHDMQLFSTDTLYLIPVGDKLYTATNGDSNVSCVAVESGGQSPFSSKWNYAYVGVIYNGQGYEYFFVSEDGAGQGLTFMKYKEMTDEGTNHLYSNTADEGYTNSTANVNMITMTSTLNSGLKAAYADKKNHTTGVCDVEENGCTAYNLDQDAGLAGQTAMLNLAGADKTKIKIYGTCHE